MSRPPPTCRGLTCTRCAAPPRRSAWPARRTRPRPPTTTCGCCCASRSASRTRARPTSCPASPATAGSGTAATSTTTAWRSSATTTCWTSPRGAAWPRDTRPASAWRTPPATSATSSATPAPPTPRVSARAVTTPTTPTSTASGSTSPTFRPGITSSRSRSIPNIWCWSQISPTTSCAATSTTPAASSPPPTAAFPSPDGRRIPGMPPVLFPGKLLGWLQRVPEIPPFPNKKRGSHKDFSESFLIPNFPVIPGFFPLLPEGIQGWNKSRDTPLPPGIHKILVILKILGNFWECPQSREKKQRQEFGEGNPIFFLGNSSVFLPFPNPERPEVENFWEFLGWECGQWEWKEETGDGDGGIGIGDIGNGTLGLGMGNCDWGHWEWDWGHWEWDNGNGKLGMGNWDWGHWDWIGDTGNGDTGNGN